LRGVPIADFLGLKTLTIINAAVKDVNVQRSSNNEEKIDIDHIDLKDQMVFDTIMKGARTTAVFQLESAGMKELILRLKPKNFDDIIALVALYRPGPMQAGMVDTFVECKNGLRAVELLHPDLGDVLGGTYGVLVYQEQVMQTAQTLAGFSLGGADMLRRAMGKKNIEEMEKQRSLFVDGCVNNGYNAQEASGIFDSIEKFAGYGFNKSHSAAYALVSYQTAWLKTHYPEHFMSAVLTQDQSELEKVVFYINECKNMEINVMPPDINTSAERFISMGKGQISFSLTAIKGIGDKQVEKIITEREENGHYQDLSDFIVRTNANKKTIEAGIKSGLFDSFGETRATMLGSFEELQEQSRRLKKRAAKETELTPQINMFGGIQNNQEVFVVRKEEMDVMSRLSGERATLGMYVSGHPIHAYDEEIGRVITGKLRDLMELQVSSEEEKITVKEESKTKNKIRKKNKMISVVGVIVSATFKKTFNGDNMAILVIDDGTSQIDATVMGSDFDRLKPIMKEDQLIYIDGSMRWKENIERYSLSSRRAMTMDEMRADKVSHVQFKLGDEVSSESTLKLLKEQALNSQRGPSKIEIMRSDNGDVSVLPSAFSVKVDETTVGKFKSILGEDNVRVFYKNEKIPPSKNISDADIGSDVELKQGRQSNRKKYFEEAMLMATGIYATR
jgi:DNA polymerase-3 subunit alpha